MTTGKDDQEEKKGDDGDKMNVDDEKKDDIQTMTDVSQIKPTEVKNPQEF